MTYKDNWNKPPEIPHKMILKFLILVWAIIVAWMLICGINPVVTATVPAAGLALMYLFVRITP